MYIILAFPISIRHSSMVPDPLSDISLFQIPIISKKLKSAKTELPVDNCFPDTMPDIAHQKKYSVVIVEENEDLCIFLTQILSDSYMVTTVSDAESAFDIIRKNQPDIVLCAGSFTGLSGEEFSLQLKSDMKMAHIPVILFKELVDIESDYRWVADCCLTIPYNISRLRREMKNLIFNREILRKRYLSLTVGTDNIVSKEELLKDEEQLFMAKVRKLIEENISDPDFNLDVLSVEMNMSRSSFFMKMKNIMHMAPNAYMHEIKMNRALALLMSRRYTVEEVAELVGYSNAKHFRVVFKKQYGESPMKFVNTI